MTRGGGIAAGRHIKSAVSVWFRPNISAAARTGVRIPMLKIVAFPRPAEIVMSGGEGEMIPGSFTLAGLVAKSLVGMSLLLPVAIDRTAPWLLLEPGTAASIDQRNAVVETLVSSATECIARTV